MKIFLWVDLQGLNYHRFTQIGISPDRTNGKETSSKGENGKFFI